ncbi:hypothetical protein BU26DRAFT_500048 [Trematosphaeria pertusa]|uniref:Uncharacterized protein n=1 Tax=Trematosphaeria pertusa TaxID=390896 RepID=A0A6A6IUM6_9PLEO|nr:uncharacterized protein BU26DRAFT_500048 [Trematosphaeria pertusa]KAF2254261.1 hypothetical protein BU26DRAFT_500048 [Trematosphaeria pertusa]
MEQSTGETEEEAEKNVELSTSKKRKIEAARQKKANKSTKKARDKKRRNAKLRKRQSGETGFRYHESRTRKAQSADSTKATAKGVGSAARVRDLPRHPRGSFRSSGYMESAMTGKLEPSIPATAYSSLHQVVMPAFVCTSCILPNQMTARYADQRSMSSNVVRQATWYVEQCGTSRSVVHRAARKWSGAACQAAQKPRSSCVGDGGLIARREWVCGTGVRGAIDLAVLEEELGCQRPPRTPLLRTVENSVAAPAALVAGRIYLMLIGGVDCASRRIARLAEGVFRIVVQRERYDGEAEGGFSRVTVMVEVLFPTPREVSQQRNSSPAHPRSHAVSTPQNAATRTHLIPPRAPQNAYTTVAHLVGPLKPSLGCHPVLSSNQPHSRQYNNKSCDSTSGRAPTTMATSCVTSHGGVTHALGWQLMESATKGVMY